MIRLQQVAITNNSIVIAYVREEDVNTDIGVFEARQLEIDSDTVPQPLIEDLIDAAMQIIDLARVRRNEARDEHKVRGH